MLITTWHIDLIRNSKGCILKNRFSLGNIDEFKLTQPQRCSIFKDVDTNQQENSRIASLNRKLILHDDNGLVRMDRNLEPLNKTSCNNKFFKPKEKAEIRMSFQDFLKANKLNKDMKIELLDTHYNLGEEDDQINSTHRQFLTKKKSEQLLHHLNQDDKDELLWDYYKRRNETQNFTIKDDFVTESLGPNETTKFRPIMTPNIKSSKKLDEFKPMTNAEFTKTNYKVRSLLIIFSLDIKKIYFLEVCQIWSQIKLLLKANRK